MGRGKEGEAGGSEGVSVRSGEWVTPEDELATGRIIAAAIAVHRELGPGFVESVYQRALSIELDSRQIKYRRECVVEILYGGSLVGHHRLDLVAEDGIVVELKAIRTFEAVHFAQLRSYLRAANLRIGLLLNFALPRVAVKRIITRRIIPAVISEFPSPSTFPRVMSCHANLDTPGASRG
jgi:GxxExxY protein